MLGALWLVLEDGWGGGLFHWSECWSQMLQVLDTGNGYQQEPLC